VYFAFDYISNNDSCVSAYVYMYKLIEFGVWAVGAKGAGVNCLFKALFFCKLKFRCERSHCGGLDCRHYMYHMYPL
jgi:hypothetical protein